MGTRADFYVKDHDSITWIGSVAWDGYQWAEDSSCDLMSAKTKDEFMAAINKDIAARDDFTSPEMGWPWPWDDSGTTDFAYLFSNDSVTSWNFGEEHGADDPKVADWMPDMSSLSAPTLGKRSGVIVISG